MTQNAIRQAVMEALQDAAPGSELSTLQPGESLREQLDLDSFDFLNLLLRLHQRLGVEVAEADYDQVQTLDALVTYLTQRLP